MNYKDKICLGTANFGNNYAGLNGLNLNESRDLFDHFIDSGFSRVDTASGYGKALSYLLQMDSLSQLTEITTKISFNEPSEQVFETCCQEVQELFEVCEGIVSVLSHDPCLTPLGRNRYERFVDKFNRIYKSIGVSIYNIQDIEEANYLIEKVQFPASFVEGGKTQDIRSLAEKNYNISIRSIFLRGILFDGEYFKYLNKTDANQVYECMGGLTNNSDIHEKALNFVCGLDAVSEVVIGAKNKNEIDVMSLNTDCYNEFLPENSLRIDMRSL